MKDEKTLSQSSKELIEKLQSALDSHESALRFNLKQVVRGFVWKLCMANDSNKEYGATKDKSIYMAGDLDRIIDTVIETSRYTNYTNREDGEDYPTWDRRDVAEEMERVMKVLKKAGVAMEW